ncbi:VOC family protein [Actinoplanes sp. NPDC051343]|uniref:VOC family protein n=1 Tax=Actinoplanes sp. NPDC051343 TaxID=3363906 RepID=UPI0037A04721
MVGHPVDPECVPDDTEVVIEPQGGPRLFFQAVPEDKTVKNRVHVCLQPDDRDRDAEVDRIAGDEAGGESADNVLTVVGGQVARVLVPLATFPLPHVRWVLTAALK